MASEKMGHFDICREMARRGLDIRMSLLENVINLQYQKRTKGTLVTIGVDGNLVGAIGMENKFVGGLLLCDREQYFKLRDELAAESAAIPPAPQKVEDFDAWWERDGKFFDPDTDDVPWFDKRKFLAEYAWHRAKGK